MIDDEQTNPTRPNAPRLTPAIPLGAKVLVVDDNPTNVAAVVSFLEERGFEATIARDGQTALQRVPRMAPNVVLLDALMPDMDGFETCRRLVQLEAMKDVPVIFMTALASMEEKLRAFQAGAVDYVIKPVQREELLVRMETHLSLQAKTAELRRLRQEDEVRLRQLEDLNQAKDRFFSIVAHDLRGPLTPLFGCAALLGHAAQRLDDSELRRISLLVDEGVTAISDLLENLLKWAALQRGRLSPRWERMQVGLVVQEVVRLAEPQAASKRVRVHFDVAAGDEVASDPGMVSTVVRNTLSNAVKFSEPGDEVLVRVRPAIPEGCTDAGAEFVCISVQDFGVGMAEETKRRLHEASLRQSRRGTADEAGAGLGMRISAELIASLHGQLNIDSTAGEGTEVSIYLPRLAPPGSKVRPPGSRASQFPPADA